MKSYSRSLNRYRRKRPKVDASIFDSALSHTRRSDASQKKKEIACPLLDVSACGQVSSPRLYRLRFKRLSKLMPPSIQMQKKGIRRPELKFFELIPQSTNFSIYEITYLIKVVSAKSGSPFFQAHFKGVSRNAISIHI